MKVLSLCGLFVAGLALTLTLAAQTTPPPKPAASPAPAAGKTFATARQAADALIAAVAAADVDAIEALFGPDGNDLVATGDAVQDKNRFDEFTAKAKEHKAVVVDPANPDRAILSVGTNGVNPLMKPISGRGKRDLAPIIFQHPVR